MRVLSVFQFVSSSSVRPSVISRWRRKCVNSIQLLLLLSKRNHVAIAEDATFARLTQFLADLDPVDCHTTTSDDIIHTCLNHQRRRRQQYEYSNKPINQTAAAAGQHGGNEASRSLLHIRHLNSANYLFQNYRFLFFKIKFPQNKNNIKIKILP